VKAHLGNMKVHFEVGLGRAPHGENLRVVRPSGGRGSQTGEKNPEEGEASALIGKFAIVGWEVEWITKAEAGQREKGMKKREKSDA